MNSDKKFFYYFDGDKIGERINFFIMTGELEYAKKFSKKVEKTLDEIGAIMKKYGLSCVFRGGDSALFYGAVLLEDNQIPFDFEDISFSVGIGTSSQMAALSLFRAKIMGRKRVERIIL